MYNLSQGAELVVTITVHHYLDRDAVLTSDAPLFGGALGGGGVGGGRGGGGNCLEQARVCRISQPDSLRRLPHAPAGGKKSEKKKFFESIIGQYILTESKGLGQK